MTNKSKMRLTTALISLTLLTAAPAISESADGDQLRSFTPDYFAQYAPRTALDMVARVPGFQLSSGDSKRGLGQGGANVLLNGQRLTGKSGDPFDQIDRISADKVTAIEIVDGASLNIPGLTGQVANIITDTDDTKTTGTFKWNPEFRKRQEANLFDGAITVSGKRGDLSYSAELKNDSSRNGHWGPEFRTLGDGTLYEINDEDARYYGDNPGGSLDLTWTPKEDHTAHLNMEYFQYNFNDYTVSNFIRVTDPGIDEQGIYTFAEDEWNAKIDGDYEFPFADGKLKLIGYYRIEDSPTVSRYDLYDRFGTLYDSTRYAQDADEGEAIGRVEYGWSPSEGRDWQIAAEGVFNFLDIESAYIDRINPENSETYDRTRVEELRGETTLTHTRALSPKWDLQASAGAEYSEISQGPLIREFIRPKGFLSATYKPKDNFNIRTRVEREVGQLNFYDFISSVDLQDDFDRAANPNLVPSQSWLGEVEFDRQFEGGHSIQATFYGALISDLVARVPLGEGGDGIGNIDSAHRYGFDINATLKGEPVGLKGVEVELELDWRDSSVDDPVTGRSHRLNNDKEYYVSVFFRHDIPQSDWAYGFFAEQYRDSSYYRLTAVDNYEFRPLWSHAFIEHKDIFGLKVNVSLRNLFEASDDFTRVIYDDRRDIGQIVEVQDRKREFGRFVRLEVSGTF